MPTIQATAQTVVRDASGGTPINIKPGQKLAVSQILPATGQMLEIVLGGNAGTLKQGDRRSIYAPHWQLPLPWGKPIAPKGVKLNALYCAQNDTSEEGYRQCFSHATFMAASFLKPSLIYEAKKLGYSQPELLHINRLTGDTTDPSAQLGALERSGIAAYYTQTLSPKDLYELLQLGICVPVGLSWKNSGHWVCVVGQSGTDWLIHDPNGVRNGVLNEYVCRSTDRGREGAFDVYSQSAMDQLFWDLAQDAQKESGWAIVITEVDGRPTGARRGM